ncbi:MAG: restriction endonuclease subunit S [Dehalococcoidales bacterium]|nr:restriction endonuclease subunit S [Dehalococcoidales bacterium]
MFFTISNKILAPGDRSTPWLLQYSKHLNYKPIKYLCSINNSSLPETTPPDYQFKYIDINSVDSKGRRVSSESLFFRDAPSRARRIVRNEDVIISTVRTYLKAISYIEEVENKLVCSTGFAVMTPGSEVFPKFLFYWACSDWFVNEIVARSVGVSYPAINAIEIGNLPFPVINVKEQQVIADYLDQETAKIDQLVEKKKRLIELLEEQRTAIITHAVTKGLNPGVEMKDSGVEWLGEIPAHWETKKLKSIGWIRAGAGFPDAEQGLVKEGLPFYKVSDMNLDGNEILMKSHNNSVSKETAKRLGATIFPSDTIIFPKVGIALLTNKRRILHCQACLDNNTMGFYVRVGSVKFMYYRLLTLDFGRLANPGAVPSMNESQVNNLYINIPPIEEQQVIADYLDKETARIDNLINKINQAIEKLQEYRSALITAAVTGKIDVRQHAS